jgi:hypothetical protein
MFIGKIPWLKEPIDILQPRVRKHHNCLNRQQLHLKVSRTKEKLTAGILKDHADDFPSIPREIPPPPAVPEPTIVDAIYNEKIDTTAMAKYPPLIPLPPENHKKGKSWCKNVVDYRHFEERKEGSQDQI